MAVRDGRYGTMKIVIIGSSGRLGAALTREYRDKHDIASFNHAQLNLSNLDDVREKLRAMDFDVLINAAAFTNVDLCETELDRAFLINAEAPGVLATICRDKRAKLIHFSTDYVFDGEKRASYTEADEAKPISVYGKSKLAGEKNVLAGDNAHLVLRVSWVFGPDRPSFIDGVIKRARENGEVDAIADKFSAPTYTRDIAAALPRFFTPTADYGGIVHFANAGECSWQEYGQWALDCCHEAGVPLKATTVGARKLKDMANWVARRPVYSVLSTAKYTKLAGMPPRTWRDAVADYITRFYFQKMKTPIVAFALSIIFSLSARAELKWEQTMIELHPMPADKQAIGHFKYQNPGKTPVHFKSVHASCGCTTAQTQKDEVPPGGSGEITATFNIGDRTGTQVKTVTVETDETPNSKTVLTLRTIIPQQLEISPTFVFWKQGDKPDPKTITVKVGKDFTVKHIKVTSSSPDFQAKVEEKGNGEFKIDVQPQETKNLVASTLTIQPEDSQKVFYATARITNSPVVQ